MRLKPSSKKSTKRKIPQFRIGILCIFFACFGIFLGWKDIPGFLKANLVLFTEAKIFDALMEENNLDTIQLDISFKNLQRIEAKRQKAIQIGRLITSGEDLVNAEIRHNGKTSRCKIRLKGDLSDHWTGDKFSLRVEMKGDARIRGMSRFSLQDPVTRCNTSEWMYLENLRQEGCMAVRYDFVNLNINGKKMGIFAIEEHFSKEMIEANKRREGVIVHFDDYLLWKKFPEDIATNIDWNSIFRSAQTTVRSKKRIQASEILKKQKVTAFNLLRSLQKNALPASAIFDSEKLGRFLAITRIWQTERSMLYADINFYFNPVTCLLEPIGFDGNPGQEETSPYCYFSWGDIKDNWVNYALSDPKITYSYIKFLHQFTDPSYIENLFTKLSSRETKYRNLLKSELLLKSPSTIWKNYSSIINYNPKNIINNRAATILEELSEEVLIKGYARINENNTTIEISISNTTTQPVEIIGFTSGNFSWDAKKTINDYREEKNQEDDFNGSIQIYGQGNGFKQSESDKIFVIEKKHLEEPLYANVRFLGSPNPYLKILIPIDESNFKPKYLPYYKKGIQNLTHPNFIIEKNNTLYVKTGSHFCKTNIFVPRNKALYLSPGTQIHFDQNSTLISEGTLRFHGSKENPIVLTSNHESWAGMLLAFANKKSILENVIIENINGIGKGPNPFGLERNGWFMTGGVTIYNSNIVISNSIFKNFKTEDALNIISSNFTLDHCTFSLTSSDAFDGDFVEGNIRNCTFFDIDGDGIDFSGSIVKVNGVNFSGIADKAISVGENSHVKINNCEIENVSFGVVSKDHSKTEVYDKITVRNAKVSAFAAYQKKPLFGPAYLKVENPLIIDCKRKYLIQHGSTAFENTHKIGTEKFSTDSLY